MRDGATFAEQANVVTFDLTGDEALQERKRRELRWDKKKKKFIRGTGEGADNVKLVKTESGAKLPATYRSGRFDEWRAKSRVNLPKVGEAEAEGAQRRGALGAGGRKWKHTQIVAAKPLDKLSKTYERKVRHQKIKGEGSGVNRDELSAVPPRKKGDVLGRRTAGKSAGKVKTELKTVEQIRKARKIVDHKRARNARPGRWKGRR